MELKWLEDFLALSATGNFRIAAQRRCVSQPAFSRRIQSLEAWIEATLIDRSGQPSQLTEAGQLFRPVARQIVDLARAGRDDVQRQVQEEKERIRFSTLGTLAQIFIPAWLKSLRPYIEADQFSVNTEFGTVSDYFAALEVNAVDFFVTYESPGNRFQNDEETFTSLKLGEEALVPVVSPDDQGKPRWDLSGTSGEPIPCLHSLSRHSPWPIKHHMAGSYKNITFRSVYESSNGTTLKEMAVEGFGLAWIPNTLVANDLDSGRLVRAAKATEDIIVDIRIYRCAKFNEPRAEKFWQSLMQQQSVGRGLS